MTLKIISAEKIEFEGTVTSVTMPGAQGMFQVLDNHAALIAALKPGLLTYVTAEGTATRDIKGGVADIKNNVVSVCLY
ncbi:MAG: F0F1 ATP synthase subunit epsilon [Bacteroidales bacterium]|nr:F0F1 ATP synthase subunit epsilon [Candidatus Sodaliphilus aphodohippi]